MIKSDDKENDIPQMPQSPNSQPETTTTQEPIEIR